MSDLRGEIFELWGAVSALALPPLIPIREWHLRASRGQSAALLAGAAGALSVTLERYERIGGYLYLSVSGSGLAPLLDRLDASIGRNPEGSSGDPPFELFPCHAGFLLAGPDLDVPTADVERTLGIPTERRFGSYGLSVLSVRTHAPRDRWWDLVSWEEEVHVPVKRSGRAAPGSGARRTPGGT